VSELIRLLIVGGSVNVNMTTSKGFNALHLLCCYNNSNDKSLKNAIQLLLNEGIDVNAKTDNGFTALHFTCRNYSNPETLVDILLQKVKKSNHKYLMNKIITHNLNSKASGSINNE